MFVKHTHTKERETGKPHLPGLANINTRSILGLRAATASAKHPPNESPTRYIGFSGDKEC